ncbi:MAG: ATP-binding protein, partial [Chloroflexi bacterium]|nr:ATP-binding protein [Chloroflexota bacterium]
MNIGTQTESFLRVKASKVSSLLDLVGELGLATTAVTHHASLTGAELAGFDTATHHLELLVHQVQDLASSLRLVQIGDLFRQMQRTARDLAHETGKPIELVLEGEDTEIDKVLVDELRDPLIHLIRNAADHGLEGPADRRAAGKADQGRITLTAAQRGQEIHITVADDGRGLDRQAILSRAKAVGLAVENVDDATVWGYIFNAGFSTASQVSNLSGRGVGMDVVQNAVRSLRGRIDLDTRPGEGTRVTLVIPLTLAFLESLVVRASGRFYAIPIEVIRQVFKPQTAEVVDVSADGSELIRRQSGLIPVVRLQDITDDASTLEPTPLSDQVIVVVESTNGAFGLPVDQVVGQQQVVMKWIGPASDSEPRQGRGTGRRKRRRRNGLGIHLQRRLFDGQPS